MKNAKLTFNAIFATSHAAKAHNAEAEWTIHSALPPLYKGAIVTDNRTAA